MTVFQLEEILRQAVARNCSDIHLVVGKPPTIRVDGELLSLSMPVLGQKDIEEMLFSILSEKQRQELRQNWHLDFSYSVSGLARFRGSAMRQRGSFDVVLRTVPWEIPSIEELGLPEIVKEFAKFPRGLVLVTGPTGSGKSTTLAALIDLINRERAVNIVTIENPIEFLHSHQKSIVRQREVGTDTPTFAAALRHILRHDPDVILIGEMRDLESISIALTAAETGDLVFSTLHTQTAPLAVHRIIDVFPETARNYVRQQLADSLQGVVSQQLVPRADGKGRVAAVEVLVNTPAVSNLIREGNEHQLYTAMQTGRSFGMQTMDSALANLYRRGLITKKAALARAVNRGELERVLR